MNRAISLILIYCCALMLWGNTPGFDVKEISSELLKGIDTSLPIYLEIRAGEFSSALQTELSMELLTMGADLREAPRSFNLGMYDSSDEEMSFLKNSNLIIANLVQVNMDIGWQLLEHKGIFTYHSKRIPVYNFEVKTIRLPEQRLMALSTYKYTGKPGTDRESNISIRWFDPIIASAALGSLIYLLWTTE